MTMTQKYGKDKSEDNYRRAVALIKEKLPSMRILNALLMINLGKEEDILVDARQTPPVLLLETTEEPDCRFQTKPEYLIQFSQGKLEPRYALFKDAFFHEASMPKGDICVAIKFGDLLCPISPVPPKVLPVASLPTPTEDLDRVRADIAEFGYGLVKDALAPEQIATLKKAVLEQAAGEVAAGVAAKDGGPNAPNQRIWTLINKGQEFIDLLQHPLIDEIVPDFLGEHALIHSYSANIARPGNVPMQLHTDQVAIQPPNVTAENGGTRVYPGSHLGHVAPDDIFDLKDSVAAQGPAGTALVFESRLWHATGPNIQQTGERPVILMFFMRSFIRQQENNFLSLREDVERDLPDKVKAMLGFCTTGALGGVEGDVREGQMVKRLKNPVGALRKTTNV
ncbi:hypothetical protein N7533_002534 [Penicillium manginii]|uniref:uncharacterized protein n=1 Tax=Penicillium manginii TaxID=203109 RepID=UPI002546F071|nr:uncharacterized protein N7533_002534 [Penicillium manginii]KAJ5763853.1 hypothetical protein N7533_002534 [Penicillium manginii]